MESIDIKTWMPIGIALIALLVSLLNLYLSQLRSASVSIVAGELVNVHHFSEGNCAISVAISITNSGARPATVRRFGLLVQADQSAEGYLLEPFSYERIDENGNMKPDSLPVPITVPGRGAEAKQVLFRSSFVPPTDFQLIRSGSYKFTILAWIKRSSAPQAADRFSILVSDDDAQALQSHLLAKRPTFLRLRQSLWRKWAAHKLTDLEVSALNT